jgi:hypothetical protein
MTAGEWQTAELQRMLAVAAGRISARKLDLFNSWCCQILRPYFTDRRTIAAARFAERHVDEGWPDTEEHSAILTAARQAVEELREWWKAAPTTLDQRIRRVYALAALVAQQTIGSRSLPTRGVISNAKYTAHVFGCANDDTRVRFSDEHSTRDRLGEQHLRLQAVVFRDIVGDPFHPVEFDPRWRTSDVIGLARGIFEESAFARLPILADALMDAGCEDERIISHCRGDGHHVRGCWVVDLALDKC